MLKKIAIVGPEASGKSFLTETLAKHFNTSYAKEYSREYLSKIGLNYRKDDLINIAKGQIKLEEKAIKLAKEWVFFDTEILVIKVWSSYKYGSVDPRILEQLKSRNYNLYLLLKPDLVYENDPLRENPSFEERTELFNIYKRELKQSNQVFKVVEGIGEERVKSALKILESIFI